MSVQAITSALAMHGITSAEKFVLVVLANYADHDMKCWPSQARLAADVEMSERNVRRLLKMLEDKGLVRRQHRDRRQSGARNSDMLWLQLHADTLSGRNGIHADTVSEPTGQARPNHADTMSGNTKRTIKEPSARKAPQPADGPSLFALENEEPAPDLGSLFRQLAADLKMPRQ